MIPINSYRNQDLEMSQGKPMEGRAQQNVGRRKSPLNMNMTGIHVKCDE
jgi:hypothetical protein